MPHFEIGTTQTFVAYDDDGNSLTIIVAPVFQQQSNMRDGQYQAELSLKELSTRDGEHVSCVEGTEGQFYRCSDPSHIYKSDDELAIKLTAGRKQSCRRC
jgi:hypothetical protein